MQPLSVKLSEETNPQINSIMQNKGIKQFKETLYPSFNVIDETQYSKIIALIIIPEFNTQLNHG